MNASFTKSTYSRILFVFLFVFVSPIERRGLQNFDGPWRVIAAYFQTF
jgi:hypothetical protein